MLTLGENHPPQGLYSLGKRQAPVPSLEHLVVALAEGLVGGRFGAPLPPAALLASRGATEPLASSFIATLLPMMTDEINGGGRAGGWRTQGEVLVPWWRRWWW